MICKHPTVYVLTCTFRVMCINCNFCYFFPPILASYRTYLRNPQQAVIEKFALCEDHLAKLLEWITRVEQDIAAVGGPKERVDDLRNQINSLKVCIDETE